MGPNFFIKRPRFAFVISIVITLMGLLAGLVMPVDQFPDISAPKVVVRANYPGADTQTVIDTVASPIENEVNGAEGMVYMSSKAASDGSYTLTVTFEIGTDANQAQTEVQNRVTLAENSLPAEVRQRGVKVRKRNPDMLMVVNIQSPDNRFDGLFLSNYASLNVVGELGRIPGIGEANILGPLDYGLRAWLDPVELANRNLGVNEVIAAIKEQNAQATVGQLGAAPGSEETEFQYVLTARGRVQNEEQFGDIILKADESGSIVRLRDVARIELGSQSYKGYGEFNNEPGVLVAIYKLGDANSLEVADSVKTRMEELSQFFPEGVDYTIGHDTTEFIDASVHETVLTMVGTIVLVVLVTYLFLGSVRATLIPTIAVPVSIVGTLAVLHALGMTINTVTLFALILAIAVVVDDAIIVVENVERVMHENPEMSAPDATRKAMSEVTGPIVATSMVLFAVFGPTMLLPGITGRMFGQFGTTLAFSVFISMINALTLSPALASVIMRHESGHNVVIRGFNWGFNHVTRWYIALVEFLCRHLVVSAVSFVALMAALLYLFTAIPKSFIPNEDKGFFIVDVQLPQAASLTRTEEVMDEIAEALKLEPAMENVLSVNGYSILNTALQSNSGMVIAKLKPWGERKDPAMHQTVLQQKYQAMFNKIPEAQTLVFGTPAIPGLGAIAGTSYVLQDTQGRSPQILASAMNEVIQKSLESPEIMRSFSTFRPNAPQIRVNVDRIRAKTLGVSISDIFLTLQTNLGGLYVNDFNMFGQSYRVMLQADTNYRQTEADLDKLYLKNNKGELVPISALISLEDTVGPDVAYRYNTFNSVTVTGVPDVRAGFSSGDAMAVMDEITAKDLPDGFKAEWTDSSFEERKAGNAVPIALGLSLIFTFLFLAALYESFLTPVAVLLTVPLALLGSLGALAIAGMPLSLYGQIGLLMMIALAAKTAILIVEFGKQQREAAGLGLHEAAMASARLRFRPVMMTVLAFVVGVYPLVVASGAGAAGRASLGVTVFGGALAAAAAGSIYGPVLFKAVQGLREKIHGGRTLAPES